MSRLAAWPLKARERDLEFGVGAQGPGGPRQAIRKNPSLLGAREHRDSE